MDIPKEVERQIKEIANLRGFMGIEAMQKALRGMFQMGFGYGKLAGFDRAKEIHEKNMKVLAEAME